MQGDARWAWTRYKAPARAGSGASVRAVGERGATERLARGALGPAPLAGGGPVPRLA